MRRLARLYGASPLHLLTLLASSALAAYAGVRLLAGAPWQVAAWVVGAAVAHDLVLAPLYALADAPLAAAARRRGARELPGVPWVNHVRFPAVVSGVLLLVFAPSILRWSGGYQRTTELSSEPYLGRWLLITAALFALSAAAYALRLSAAARRRTPRRPR